MRRTEMASPFSTFPARLEAFHTQLLVAVAVWPTFSAALRMSKTPASAFVDACCCPALAQVTLVSLLHACHARQQRIDAIHEQYTQSSATGNKARQDPPESSNPGAPERLLLLGPVPLCSLLLHCGRCRHCLLVRLRCRPCSLVLEACESGRCRMLSHIRSHLVLLSHICGEIAAPRSRQPAPIFMSLDASRSRENSLASRSCSVGGCPSSFKLLKALNSGLSLEAGAVKCPPVPVPAPSAGAESAVHGDERVSSRMHWR